MRAASVAAGLLVALVLSTSAQGGTSPDFTRADLPGLSFGPADAPPGTHYLRGISGARLLEREVEQGVSEIRIVLRQLRRRGYVTDYGSQYEATSRRSAIGFYETLALLFRSKRGAARGLNYLLGAHRLFFPPVRQIPARGLGEASWGIRGKQGGRFTVFVYAWRIGDLVQLSTLSPNRRGVNASDNRRLANQLEALAIEPPAGPAPVPSY